MTDEEESTSHDQIVAQVAEDAPDGREQVVAAFAKVTLRRIPEAQLEKADPAAAAGQLLSAFRFIDRCEPDELALRVFTPEIAIDGWSTPGTVIELITEDRPFLLSTVTEELEHRDLTVVRNLHPILGVDRGPDGRITELVAAREARRREAFLHLELDITLDADQVEDLRETLDRHLQDLVAATDDFELMQERIRDEAKRLRAGRHTPPGDADNEEVAALLEWLLDDNLVLLGTREYEIIELEDSEDEERRATQVVAGSGAGILAREETSRLARPAPLASLPDEQRQRYLRGDPLTVSRTNRFSTVHRRSRMEYIGVKRYSDEGEVTGEFRVLGLFTRKGYAEPARTTPILRKKLERILEREDVVPGSHDEATLIALFQALPKDELFQASVDSLHETIIELFRAEEQRDTTVALRIDRFTRTVSAMVAVPRDRYSASLRHDITDLLKERFGGTHVDVDLSIGERAEALARFNVHVADGEIPDVSVEQLQHDIRELAKSWLDEVEELLLEARGQSEGARLLRAFVARTPPSYRTRTPPKQALADAVAFDRMLAAERDLSVVLHGTDEGVRLQAFRAGTPLELSSFIPILESLGLVVAEEIPHRLEGTSPQLHLHDFGIRHRTGQPIDVGADGDRIAEATLAAWHGQFETESLNRLVLSAGLSWRQVNVLRAYRRYRRQVGTAYTTSYINDTLVAHPEVVRGLIELFEARFEPHGDATPDELRDLYAAVIAACDSVERLDHDRILRHFLALVQATVRTNAYRPEAVTPRPDGHAIPYLSLKFDSGQIPDLPKPVPFREIFVYSPLLEGIHLRGGAVARGGVRWSDRQDDVRTEVLGLMKAQMLKNALIVPTGAKGGFVLKQPPEEHAALMEEVEAQYVTFVRALLDVTDNIVDGHPEPPERVVRHDGDDPYLVVAADKGTATFSDTANEIADEYGFWLGDAFASGGSRGYDHKALGITARGAWVAVERHFHELGVDPQTDPVSVVGIGDMSGDVFGNGMLRSRSIRLVAAFDHRDIFLDPRPDPEAAFEERQRLFERPGSSWQDYDRDLISAGGGVFPRTTKSIELSPAVADMLRVDAEALPPDELIQAILCAPVDLLFAGGIGTYIKGSAEDDLDVGDRVNDDVRVDANRVRARVIGEGANLAVTQRGRIEYARRGGRINQDAIDNAGGVDISDHEVNVKILLDQAVTSDRIDDDARNELLAEITDEVVAHVLRDVDLQTWRLSLELADSPRRLDAYEQLMVRLEERGPLDRAVEALPTTDEINERAEAGAGLTRPELATLLGYAKRTVAAELLDTPLPDQEALQDTLADYFPPQLVERFPDLLAGHRLRRQLIATVVANDVVDQLGITTVFRLQEERGAPLEHVLAAYWAAREIAAAGRRWQEVKALESLLGPERAMELKREIDRLVKELTRQYLVDDELPDIGRIVERDRPVFDSLSTELMDIGTEHQRSHRLERGQRLIDDLVDEDMARYLACTRDLTMVPDIAGVLRSIDAVGSQDAATVADAFLRLSSELAIDKLGRHLSSFDPDPRWSRWQHGGLAADLRSIRADAVRRALEEEPDLPGPEAIDRFLSRRTDAVAHVRDLVRDVGSEDTDRLDAVAVATRAIRDAVRR
ncbi:MAG: NAD-glutamate dehydrogenase [Nitriliruptorales bacterium]|nr:NAD-glutamate dehydrogenase [Nitriliruptorales bacterium]